MNTLVEKLRALRLGLEAAHEANPPHWAWFYINVSLSLAVCVIAVLILRDEPNRFQAVSAILMLVVFGGSLILMLIGRLAGWGR